MHVIVEPDKIKIGAEFVPRFLDLPLVLQILPGQTIDLPTGDSLYDYIEVGGTLKISRVANTTLRFTHLFVLPGGNLDIGTEEDPIPANVKVKLIVRDVPMETTRDPFRWGNGLVNFGNQTRCGAEKLPFTTATANLVAGSPAFTLSQDITGWEAGDEIYLPDTAFTVLPAKPRIERTIIRGVRARIIDLITPLTFEHLSLMTPPLTDENSNIVSQPQLVHLPPVANLTRNIVVTSENANGVHGHTANVGMDAMWCICANQTSLLGRTRNVPLDDYDPATGRIGTNQRGRYNDHNHHAMGFGSKSHHNVYIGSFQDGVGSKWGSATHGTHDAKIEDNIALGFPGAGFVTEDGYEVRNEFRRNFSAYSIGNHTGFANMEIENRRNNNVGAAGDGYWFRGLHNIFEELEAWNCCIGANLFGGGTSPLDEVPGKYPSIPGGEPDTDFDRLTHPPLAFADIVADCNTFVGLEYWGVPEFETWHPHAAYNGVLGFFHGLSDPTEPNLIAPEFIGFANQSQATSTNTPYVHKLTITGGRIMGCEFGIGGAGQEVVVKDIYLQNIVNVAWTLFDAVRSSLLDNVTMRPAPGRPKQYLWFGDKHVWNGTLPLPETPQSEWILQKGSKNHIKNWQGTGKDYRLYINQQVGSTAAWPSLDEAQQWWNCPELGLTMQQSWNKYGMSYGGGVLPDTDIVKLPGVDPGLLAEGFDTVLGPPKGIITFPTLREAARIEPQPEGADAITGYSLLTGSSTGVSPDLIISIDGDPEFITTGADARKFPIRNLTEGVHEIKTWRRTTQGEKLVSSEMLFHYVVGSAEPPELVTVPNVVGQSQATATMTIMTSGLMVGPVTQQQSDKPVGEVLSQTPAAGSSVPKGSTVSLVVSSGLPTESWRPVTPVFEQLFDAQGNPLAQFRITANGKTQDV